MKSYRKIMLVTLLLLAILTLGAVNAADVDDSDALTVNDVGGSDSIASPVNDADLLSDGNSTSSSSDPDVVEPSGNGTNYNPDDGNDDENVTFDDEGDNHVEFWIDTENEFSTNDDLDEIFATVTVSEGTSGYIAFYNGENELYKKALDDFDEGSIDGNKYSIALGDGGNFIFEGVGDDGNYIRFSFLDEDGNDIAGNDYFVFFGEGTVRFEVDAHNPGDHVSIDVSGEERSTDDENDFVWINLPSNVTEGKVIVTSGNYTLFEESINFDGGSHWWEEKDGHYVCSFAPNCLTNWDMLNDGDVVVFAFLDKNDDVVGSKEYTVAFGDDGVRFEEVRNIEVNIWGDDDERGPLYSDCKDDVVSVNVPPEFEGTIFVLVNGEEKDYWDIEDNENEWSYYDWRLNDLGITEVGEYDIEVKHDEESLFTGTLNVVPWDGNSFKVYVDYDDGIEFLLYCPETNGTVRIVIRNEDEDLVMDKNYDITSEDYNNYKYWRVSDFELDTEQSYHIDITVIEDENVTFSYGKWFFLDDNNGDDDGPLDWIELNIVGDAEEGIVLDINDNVYVADLMIPATEEFEGTEATIKILKNGQVIQTIESSDIESVFDEAREADKYPICIDLTKFDDKDALGIWASCFDEDGRLWELAVQVDGDKVILHEYSGPTIEYYVFYGNITKGDLNIEDIMGPHPDGRFVSWGISDEFNITEGTIVVRDGETTIAEYSLDNCTVDYSYNILGNVYILNLDDYDLYDILPENKNITFTFSYLDKSLTFKRIRLGDYVKKVITPDDFVWQEWSNYNFEVGEYRDSGKILTTSDDVVVIYGNSNMQSIYIDFAGGYFSIYVNNKKVEGLGYVLYEAWKNSDQYCEEYDDPSDWGSELKLSRLRGGSVSLDEFHISLADLGITNAGTYNIKVIHTPGDDPEDMEDIEGYIYRSETLLVDKNVTYDPDCAGVEILKERIYKNGQPFLFSFQFGGNVLSESNRILVYINDELAFNSTTLFWEENDEGEMELVELWKLNDGQFNEGLLNEYGVLDAGEYEAVVYLVKGDAAPVEISRGNFTVITQRGDMNFTVGYDGMNTILYADIPEGKWDGYSLEINIDDSESIVPDEDEVDDWCPRWYDEYVIFKDDEIALKESLDDIIGKGPVAIDLGVLPKGTHIWVVFYHGEETIFGDWDCYQNDFTSNYPSVVGNVTKENFFDFFDENGVLTADLTDINFIGDFTGLEVDSITINKPVAITGEEALFNNVSFIIDSDDVSITDITLVYAAADGADAYAVLVNEVSNFQMENNTILFTGITNGTYVNGALRVNGASHVVVKGNTFLIKMPSIDVYYDENSNSIVSNYPISFMNSEAVAIVENTILLSYTNSSGYADTIYVLAIGNNYFDYEDEFDYLNTCKDVVVSDNVIIADGHSYIYGISIAADDFVISNNLLNISSDNNYVCGMDIEGPSSNGEVSANTIILNAPNFAYGIYSYMYMGEIEDIYFVENVIDANAYAAFGMELVQSNIYVVENDITVSGNYSIGIVGQARDEGEISGNVIKVIASNEGNMAVMDSFFTGNSSAITVSGDVLIEDNRIVGMDDDSYVSCDDVVFDYGTSGSAEVTLIGANNIIAEVIGHEEANITFENGVITVSGLDAGNYTLSITTVPTGNYNAVTEYAFITVNKADVILSVEVNDVTVGEKATVNINVGGFPDAQVNIMFGGIIYSATAVNGVAFCDILVDNAGTQTVTVTFEGNNNYNSAVNSTTFNVAKLVPTIAIDPVGEAIEGSDLTVNVEVVNATGSVNINGKDIALVDGKATTTFTDLLAGNMVINVAYSGDAKYLNATEINYVTVKAKQNADLEVSASDIEYGQTAVVNIEINANVTGKVTIDGNEITITNGKGTYTISSLAAGDYIETVVFAGDKYFNADEKNATFKVTKVDSSVEVSNIAFDYGASASTVVNLTGASGVTAKIVGSAVAPVVDGDKITVSGLDAGTYTLEVTTVPDANHNAVAKNATVTVNKVDSSVVVSNVAFDYGASASTVVNLTGASGVTAKIVGSAVAPVVDGDKITVSGLDAGTYTLVVTTVPDANHNAVAKNATVTVNKVDSSVVVSNVAFDYGASASTVVNLTGASGVTAKIVGSAVAPVVDGDKITVSGLDVATYTLVVTTVPDANHNAVSKNATITVNKVDSSATVSNVVFDYGATGTANVAIVGATGFTARVVDHGEAVVAVNNDVVSISNLTVGTYTLEVTTVPDANHNAVVKTATVTVNKVDSSATVSNVVFDYGATGTANVAIVGATGFTVRVVDHGEAVVAVNNDVVSISNLTAGTYTLEVTTVPDANHNAITKSATITVNKIASTVSVSDISFNYGDSGTGKVTFDGATGVVASVVGYSKAVTVKDGVVTVSGLDAGQYTLIVTTVVDVNHNVATANSTITVNKLSTTLSAAQVTTTYGTSKKLVVYLKANGKALEGKNVTITLNKKVYTVETDKYGRAILAVPANLAVKNYYTASITFDGDKNYNKKTAAQKVVVNKATPKLSAAKKTFSRGLRIKTYVVVLKTDKNKGLYKGKVTLKVNSRTFTAYATSAGKVTFKINNLYNKKGTFKATVRFVGNAYYNARTVNTYIISR